MNRLLSEIVSLTPTNYEAFTRCARLFLNDSLLGIPASDPAPSTDEGLFVHELLRFVHERGSCRDARHVEDTLEGHGADSDHYRELVARHARRCPASFERDAHEVDLARFHRLPPPMFMATARIDAIFVHDGLLDARDYKTGGRWNDRVADIPGARVQAYVLGRSATNRGLRLRLRYEYLTSESDDDPDPWEPDADDFAAVEEELRSAVAKMWGDDPWRGVGEADVCRTCRYRSICPDSTLPGEPTWPALAAVDPSAP